MNKFDELFKTKLEDVQVVPTIDVWEKIQTELPAEKKTSNNKTIWKVAASLAALFLLSYIIWSVGYNAGIKSVDVVVDNQPTQPVEANQQNLLSDTEAITDLNQETQDTNQPKENFPAKLNISVDLLKGKNLMRNQFQSIAINEVPRVKNETLLLAEKELPDEVLPPVTIIYKPGIEVKETKIKRAWNYAVGLKNGDEKLPSLRSVTNDLLASNSKRKKPKSQNN